MHRLEKLFTQIRKTNSVVKSYLPVSRYLCSNKSKEEKPTNLLEDKNEKNLQFENINSPIEGSDINEDENKENKSNNLSGFAKFHEKQSALNEPKSEKPKTFAYLLRHSKLIDLGEPEGKIVSGKIVHVVDEDLHIDFGWKFNCVCKRPVVNSSDYVRGSIVRLKIKQLELSSRFLGSTKDLTILEADCILLGLTWSPVRSKNLETKLSSVM